MLCAKSRIESGCKKVLDVSNLIWKYVFEENGEKLDTGVEKCPGEIACSMFQVALGETQDGLNACKNCELLPTKHNPFDVDDADPSDEIFDEVKDIILWQNAGFETDWAAYDFEYQTLVKTWREVEETIRKIQAVKLQAFIKGFYEK